MFTKFQIAMRAHRSVRPFSMFRSLFAASPTLRYRSRSKANEKFRDCRRKCTILRPQVIPRLHNLRQRKKMLANDMRITDLAIEGSTSDRHFCIIFPGYVNVTFRLVRLLTISSSSSLFRFRSQASPCSRSFVPSSASSSSIVS